MSKQTHYKSRKIESDNGTTHEYRVTPRSAEQGLELLRQLSAIVDGIAPVIVGVALKDFSKVPLDAVGRGLVSMLDVGLVKDVLRFAERDGRPVAESFSSIYQANYGELTEAVIFALEVDFGKSLAAMGKRHLPAALLDDVRPMTKATT